LELGQNKEASECVGYLDRYAGTLRVGSGRSWSEIMRYRTLARCRLSWAESQSGEAIAALRLLYHQAIDQRDLYTGCRLAVELVGMLAVVGELEEADALFFRTIKFGAAVGLYQVFLDGAGSGLGLLLRRAYERAEADGSTDRELLPYLGSLLSRWGARESKRLSASPSSRISNAFTKRECDTLEMISRGLSNKRVAQALNISPETVKSHVKRIFSKLGVSTRTEAVSRANSLGLR
jgi:LuxR family maltose regulon positive regulatory protein